MGILNAWPNLTSKRASEKATYIWLFQANFDLAQLHYRLGRESDSSFSIATKNL